MTNIQMLEEWKPGRRLFSSSVNFKPLWAWSVKSRRRLWDCRQHPKKYKHEKLWSLELN